MARLYAEWPLRSCDGFLLFGNFFSFYLLHFHRYYDKPTMNVAFFKECFSLCASISSSGNFEQHCILQSSFFVPIFLVSLLRKDE